MLAVDNIEELIALPEKATSCFWKLVWCVDAGVREQPAGAAGLDRRAAAELDEAQSRSSALEVSGPELLSTEHSH